MRRLQVLWATKWNDTFRKDELRVIGGVDESGSVWALTVEDAIVGISTGVWEFYLIEEFLEIPVKTDTYRGSETYLTATGKGYVFNLLEELPVCNFLEKQTRQLVYS